MRHCAAALAVHLVAIPWILLVAHTLPATHRSPRVVTDYQVRSRALPAYARLPVPRLFNGFLRRFADRAFVCVARRVQRRSLPRYYLLIAARHHSARFCLFRGYGPAFSLVAGSLVGRTYRTLPHSFRYTRPLTRNRAHRSFTAVQRFF